MTNIIVFIVALLALLALVFSIYNTITLIKLSNFFTKNKSGIKNIVEEQKKTQEKYNDIKRILKEISKTNKSYIKAVEVVHFNPFAGSGTTRLSFALCALSENGDGFILSTLHHKNNVSVFTKKVINFKPEKTISEEEKQALEKTINSLHNKNNA